MFACTECGRKFKTVRAAERASHDGCPGCGGVDIDIAPDGVPGKAHAKNNPHNGGPGFRGPAPGAPDYVPPRGG